MEICYAANGKAYIAKLEALDAEMKGIVNTLP